ncbi:MAG: hypothetical protein GIW99_03445 [Candidatus Eremiobacteraeota bacterium]|nr:hypothetical protein [Candidatus Eremiobacteraeota bacterium]MBC5826727.1 hypothetical protein [Candidatus Eremiobacteraeota bacterium]
MSFSSIGRRTIVLFLAFAALAGCSTNGGFGNAGAGQFPPGNQNGPLNSSQQNPAGSPPPSGSDAAGDQPSGFSPSPGSTATPVTALSVDSASARLAFDAAANVSDRLLDVAFALKNPGAKPLTAKSLTLTAEGKPVGAVSFVVTALPNQTTQVTAAAIPLAKGQDAAKLQRLTLVFADAAGKMLAQSSIDAPHPGLTFGPLDETHPAGPPSIDSLDVERVAELGRHPRYECSFAITNPGKEKLSIAKVTIAPPKGRATDAAIGVDVPPRTMSGIITVVLPYGGKSLPAGKYTATATGRAGEVITKASAELM